MNTYHLIYRSSGQRIVDTVYANSRSAVHSHYLAWCADENTRLLKIERVE